MTTLRFCLAAALLTSALIAQKDAGGVPAPTEALERGRTVYVLSACHYCHGVDLAQTAMGAANLLHSRMVGADVGGNLMGPLIKAGLPALQTSMPSYYDMTPQEITDLSAYIHYLRQKGRYAELKAAPLPAGDTARGKTAFRGSAKCAGCHTPKSLVSRLKKTPPERTDQLLLPAPHSRFTENAQPAEVADLLAYLDKLR